MSIITVPLSRLQVSPYNVRINREDAEATAALEASILAHGLLEPMIVHPLAKPKDSYGVYAGGRRLRAMHKLQERGDLPADHSVDVVVRELTEAQITEASAAENMMRRNLRPYEIYAAFTKAVDRGVKVRDLARHFGQREIYVEQVLRLGRLAPAIFAELEAGRLSDDQARAYAATEDHALQLAIFDRMEKLPAHSWQRHDPREIRKAMKVGDRTAAEYLAFVGQAEYEKAGGRWERDLFEEAEKRGRVVDEQLLARLVEEKLAAVRASIEQRAARPIAFADVPPTTGGQNGYTDYDLKIDRRLSPLSAADKARKELLDKRRLELEALAREQLLDDEGERRPGLEAEEAALDAEYDPIVAELAAIEDGRNYVLPKVGEIVATIEIDAHGRPEVKFWFASKKAMKESQGKKASAPAIADGAVASGNYAATKAATGLAKDQVGLTAGGIEIFRSLRRTFLRALLVHDAGAGGSVATDYLVWSQLRGAIFNLDSDAKGAIGAFTISAGMYESMGDPEIAMPFLKDSEAYAIWNRAIDLLKQQSFVTSKNMGGAFIDFQNAKPELKAIAAAVVAGLSLQRSINSPGFSIDVHDVVANMTNKSYPAALRSIWTPTAALIDLLPKARRAEIVEPMVDAKTFAAWGKKKAGEITDLAVKVLTGRSPSLKSGSVNLAKEWVHPLLQFGRPNVLETVEPAPGDREAA